MSLDQYEIAQILREIGIFIELQDENPLRGLSYRRAASSIENIEHFDEWIKRQELETLPGIGEKIANLIYVLKKEGRLTFYDKLKKKIPSTVYELLNIPGISVQKVRILFKDLHISDLKSFRKLLKKKNLKIPGFSPSFVKKMQKRTEAIQKEGFCLLEDQAMALAEQLISKFKKFSERIMITGALRRKCECIYSIEILALSSPSLIEEFILHPLVLRVVSRKKSEIKALLKKGIVTTLYLASKRNFPFLLLKTTGSRTHIEKLNKITSLKKYKKRNFHSEQDIYADLKLPFIPPELREDGSEIQAARKGKLPLLIEEEDLQGTFHCHTNASDGVNTIQEMVNEAKKLGWTYLGISDHSKSLKIANGMNEERLYLQLKEIRHLNKKDPSFYIFAGIECDIMKEGNLDFSDEILRKLDFVIVSVHSLFKMEKKEMTKRLIRAIEHPLTTMIGHLTGRLLRYREPYLLDIPKILDACAANHKVIELNAYPNRMDMDWRYWRLAKGKKVKCCINPDAHSLGQLSYCKYGVYAARKGWLEKENVINTLPLNQIKAFLKN